jgi:hypothetical protein
VFDVLDESPLQGCAADGEIASAKGEQTATFTFALLTEHADPINICHGPNQVAKETSYRMEKTTGGVVCRSFWPSSVLSIAR